MIAQSNTHVETVPASVPGESSQFDDLIARILASEEDAWQAFVAQVHPLALAICRRRGFGGAPADRAGQSHREDMHRDVVTRTLDRLRARDCNALRRYVDTRPVDTE